MSHARSYQLQKKNKGKTFGKGTKEEKKKALKFKQKIIQKCKMHKEPLEEKT
jgi:hypothetical protein